MDQIENNPKLVKCQGRCKQYLPRESFYRNRSKPNGLSIFCKECANIAVKNYQEKKKENPSSTIICIECGKKRNNYRIRPDGICGRCKHKEKAREKYRANPEYFKTKNRELRQRRAAIDAEIEREELEIQKNQPRLTKAEMFIMTRFHDSSWLTRRELDPMKVSLDELKRLEELGLIKARDDSYALTEKGLEFLGFAPLEVG